MRLATFTDRTAGAGVADRTAGAGAPGRTTRVGVVRGDRVHPLDEPATMRELVERGLPAALEAGERALFGPSLALDDVRLELPLEPASVRDCVAFAEHVDGVRRSIDGASGVPDAWYDAPTFYFTNPHALYGPDTEVPFPATSVARDFELEVAVVVGREGRSLSEEDAREHVFGYALFDDFSARDLQGREMQVSLGAAKGKDFATGIGPWIVTADELDPYRDGDGFLDLWCTASVNGVEVGRDLLSNSGWTFEAMIAYASRDSLVRAGDLIGSGTVGHGGCLAELWGRRGTQDPPPLRDGDVVTIAVEHLGSLTHTVTSAPPAPAVPAPRRRDPHQARTQHTAHTKDQ
ncbi:2-keto-4-pentenoate hydratase/2-oxohepta-3-ene-1,7-dioic acid hydratase in catechol pathway [Mumia flava]|uniref:2-keto-4-pentenoate hydratase/2-oxohepta-3-ene-1,7-dioic acid hydratase in catechol pathway n=1 Tax=Mumia flava TaxID=1348852 RepID=A0A2M9B8W3_9ACTN|nr:fumarylacetoacetate hydrolase family protein [Mumia flava]PJJ54371.1 2-keto-4-pentenoate hydratase/2-oxohepta-3-ene-1,7-dioic acid hydratase in catechol pathway [Mumia flava]